MYQTLNTTNALLNHPAVLAAVCGCPVTPVNYAGAGLAGARPFGQFSPFQGMQGLGQLGGIAPTSYLGSQFAGMDARNLAMTPDVSRLISVLLGSGAGLGVNTPFMQSNVIDLLTQLAGVRGNIWQGINPIAGAGINAGWPIQGNVNPLVQVLIQKAIEQQLFNPAAQFGAFAYF